MEKSNLFWERKLNCRIWFFFEKKISWEKKIPSEVFLIMEKLNNGGFVAFLVGGCIRDLLLNRKVNDWDILTDANVKQIIAVFNQYQVFLLGKKKLTKKGTKTKIPNRGTPIDIK